MTNEERRCPECGRVFTTARGVGTHRRWRHGHERSKNRVIRIDDETWELAKARAQREGHSVAFLVRQFLEDYCVAGVADDPNTYRCPSSGELESLTDGGFDVCCDHPRCPGNRDQREQRAYEKGLTHGRAQMSDAVEAALRKVWEQ
jgi:hypothetical protein